MVIKGIDISVYQKGISFPEIVKAGVNFVIIRAGFGKTKDSQLDKFVAECKKHNLKFGFYWYSYALTEDRAKEEAEACINCIKNYDPDYPVYFDMEDKSQIDGLNKRTRTDMAIMFCETIRKAGFIPGIYANPSWFESYYKKTELVGKYDIWLACWTENPNRPTKYNYGQKVWQWGLDKIDGYNVDGNLSYYDYTSDKNTPKVENNQKSDIEIGDIVMFKGGCHYISSTAKTSTGGKRTAGLAKVTNIAPNAAHKYALRGVENGSNVYGWVNGGLVVPVEEKKDTLSIGDKVKVTNGAKTYKGGKLASFVYKGTYVVMQVGSGIAPDYVVIGNGKQITAAVKAADLTKV